MHLWGAAELLREFRFLWPVSDCAGLGLGTALLLIVLSWLSGLLTGLLIAAICFSQSCGRLLAPSVPAQFSDRTLRLRSRLSQYRQSE
jgi:hypothetical protein